MQSRFLKIVTVIFVVSIFSGCTMRSYKQVRDRVDQDMPGNAGYVSGTPVSEDRSDIRKTRTTYVLEINDKKTEAELQKVLNEPVASKTSDAETVTPTPTQNFTSDNKDSSSTSASTDRDASDRSSRLMGMDNAPEKSEPMMKEEAVGKEYRVEKGDTLQKISKKFYGGYSKWNKIYEANKNKISNPNRIKPGIVITIP